MALCCTHLATHLVEDDERFSMYAPVVMNSEVIVYRGNIADIKILGLGQQRQYLQNLAKKSYPEIKEFQEIKTSMLPYSLTTGVIDAAVLDVSNAISLSDFKSIPLSKHDYISYVLVVRNDITKTDAFEKFVESYNEVVKELNGQKESTENISAQQQLWKLAGTKFLMFD